MLAKDESHLMLWLSSQLNGSINSVRPLNLPYPILQMWVSVILRRLANDLETDVIGKGESSPIEVCKSIMDIH